MNQNLIQLKMRIKQILKNINNKTKMKSTDDLLPINIDKK